MVKINIKIADLPQPSLSSQSVSPLNSVIEKCCDYMDICKSDLSSEYQFKYLASVYKKLNKARHLPAELLDLLDRLEDFMLKYDIDRTVIDANHLLDQENK